jgi:arylsulfatase
VFTADHGEFAGDHGIYDKNIGIYESIHRVPFLIAYPGSPRGVVRAGIIESVDLFPTLCELADVPAPPGLDGRTIVSHAEGHSTGKEWALCEWDYLAPQRFVNSLRTDRYRLTYYSHELGGELYDHDTDPYEMHNLWDDPAHRETRLELLETLFDQVNRYQRKTDMDSDVRIAHDTRLTPTSLIHKGLRKWSEFEGFTK